MQHHVGSGGAPPGDLYLRVRHAAHPDFSSHGPDLLLDLERELFPASAAPLVSQAANQEKRLEMADSVGLSAGLSGFLVPSPRSR